MASIATTRPQNANFAGPASLAELVAPQLKAVDQLFARELASDLPNVDELVTHVGKFRGKMLRPTLVLLAGLAASEGPLDDRLTDAHA